jgi:hypothetical protein
MALQASGPISLADIAAEFGDTPPHSMSEFYRDGGKVPGVNSNVPASGLIRLGNFFGAVNELLQQVTAQASVNAQTIFGSNWGAAVPKRLLIPSGVTIGSLTIPTGLGGSLTVENQGEIQGLGGGPNSGAGGHAITASSSFTLTNTGAVRGGGGGGGLGGTGGQGSVSSSTSTTESFLASTGLGYYWREPGVCGGGLVKFWAGSNVSDGNGITYTRGELRGGPPAQIVCGAPTYTPAFFYFDISRTVTTTSTSYTSGGAGGAGGRGRGYGQTPLSGSGGAGGGTNAGVGGTGGSGAEWGLSGSTGNSGANGNHTGGSGGAGGGAAGRAVLMLAGTLTLNNSGTLNGAY